jgi:hypothetical protein
MFYFCKFSKYFPKTQNKNARKFLKFSKNFIFVAFARVSDILRIL